VRALARDLAAALGTVGHLTALRRTRSGGFCVDDAVPLACAAEELRARIEPLARAAARALPVVELSAEGVVDARHGRPVATGARAPGPHALVAPEGDLVAVGLVTSDGRASVLRGFSAGA
jgi:tRNA pseudouridine55 synthase